MPSAKPVSVETVTVAYVNQPEGRGPGSIKDTKNRYWKVWPDKLEEIGFKPNKTYAISFTDDEYRGKVSHTVIGAQLTNPPNAANGPATRVAQSQLPLDRDMDITVNGLAHCVPSWFAQIDLCDSAGVAQILDALELAWRMHKNKTKPGAHPNPTPLTPIPPEDEFNDEIPWK